MTTKIDLEALERNAKSYEAHRGCCDRRYMEIRPAAAIALIGRIRELDEALNDALAYTIPGEERDRLVRVLARGVVLP